MSTVFPIEKSRRLITTAQVLTASYVAGTNLMSLDNQNFAGFTLQYTSGGETSLGVEVLASIDGGITYNPQIVESPASTGIVTCATSVLTFTGTQNASFNLYPIKADFIKIRVVGVGGSPSGTVTIQGVSSWV